MSHDPMRPSIDHTGLSPSGRVSKRARAAFLKREHARLFPPGFWEEVNRIPQPTERERLLAQVARLRELADRGMRPRYHRKHADTLEAQANALTGAEK